MTDTVARLGPLVCHPGSVSVESDDSSVNLTTAGIRVQGPDPLVVPWSDVVYFAIIGPTMSRRCDGALKIFGLLSPVAPLRSAKTEIRIDTLARSHSLELEPGPEAPYDYRDLDAVEAVIDLVGDAGALPLLGDPSWLAPVIWRARAGRSWLTPLTYRRARRIVRSALPPTAA